ncbi:MAG: hypothetical protein FWD36_02740 [Treponema sp.]|nr:hypothetical protein [Treponema sp.]
MKAIYLVTVLLLCIAGNLESQQFPSLDASPRAYEYARRTTGNAVHWRDLAEAALWASAVNAGPGAEEKAAAYLARIDAAAAEIAKEQPGDIKERGEYVLNFIHSRFLKSYSAKQTRVDEIFESGRYNCVSSAVLYMVLGTAAGLNVNGVITKDHAFVTVHIGTEMIDVETTNRYGFDPGNRKEFLDTFGQTGFAYVPARNYRERTAITKVELVSLILSNRITGLEERNRYTEAVPLAINRAVFLANSSTAHSEHKAMFFEDPRKNMMTRLFNLGAHLLKTGKEDDVISWAVYAEERFPDPDWQELIKNAANNKLVKLIRAKKITDAHAVLATVKPKLSETNYRELELMVIEAEIANHINTIRNPGDAEAALASLATMGDRLPPQRRNEMQTTAILAEVSRLGKARDWTGSIQWLESALQKYGSNAKLETTLRTMRQNKIGELHNEFAALFNKKQYEQAKAAIEKALQEFPDNQQLLKNLETVEKALQP